MNWVREGKQSKDDRIERLVPDVKQSRYFLPKFVHEPGIGRCTWEVKAGELVLEPAKQITSEERRAIGLGQQALVVKPIVRKDENNELYDLTRRMIDDLFVHPFGRYDDLLDGASRIYDMDVSRPRKVSPADVEPAHYHDS